jgi:hypothetical protein
MVQTRLTIFKEIALLFLRNRAIKTLSNIYLGPCHKGFKKYITEAQKQHKMKWKKSKIVQRYGTIHSKKEVKHQGGFQNHIGRKFGSQIFIPLPAVLYTVQIKFWGPDKLGPFTHMPFQHRNGVVQ